MSDINSYANDLLIGFLDSAHEQIKSVLREAFGDSWFVDGVERHLHPAAFDRTREMLASPMAVIDMGKNDEELYGVEHLGNIVLGNWSLFGETFGDRKRTDVYFDEIKELRNNVSHRRQHHMLRRRELLRFVQNAQLLLGAFGSPKAAKFEAVAASLEQNGSPWGHQLGGILPAAIEIVTEFVGREAEMDRLSEWLTTDDARQCVIWGYGGSGKSALAYQFARAVRDGAPSNLHAVLWLSAKAREYLEEESRDRVADFDSVESFGRAFWNALYGTDASEQESTRDAVIQEMSETRLLFVVDDLDSVVDNQDLAHFLLYELQTGDSKIIYTSRQRIPGLQTIEVRGFDEAELDAFVRSRAREYELNTEECIGRLQAILSVTDGFPLFVDDLMRHAMVEGLNSAIEDWSQRRGDAARAYALRRQLSSLGGPGRRVLIAVSVAGRPVSSLELSNISGFGDDDVHHAIQSLLNWRLLTRSELNASGHPTFLCNRNTRRLVQNTYSRDPIYPAYQESFRTLVGAPRPPALRRAVGIAISDARALVLRGDSVGAEASLKSAMTGELSNNSDLWGALGWVISRDSDEESNVKARGAFQRAHSLGSRKEDTYYHWIELEGAVAEGLVQSADDQDVLARWRDAARIAELGIDRCGDTPALCSAIAYLKTREAKTLQRVKQFTSAEACFREAARWAQRAFAAPNPSSFEVRTAQLYRNLVIALEGCGDPERTVGALEEWESAVGSADADWRREHDRLLRIRDYWDYLR